MTGQNLYIVLRVYILMSFARVPCSWATQHITVSCVHIKAKQKANFFLEGEGNNII